VTYQPTLSIEMSFFKKEPPLSNKDTLLLFKQVM